MLNAGHEQLAKARGLAVPVFALEVVAMGPGIVGRLIAGTADRARASSDADGQRCLRSGMRVIGSATRPNAMMVFLSSVAENDNHRLVFPFVRNRAQTTFSRPLTRGAAAPLDRRE